MQTDRSHSLSMPADAEFDTSAIAHAYRTGVNAAELDALAQAISRLARDGSTVLPATLETDFKDMRDLGYVELSAPVGSEKINVTLLCPGALLSSYFWSVWVRIPRSFGHSVHQHLDSDSTLTWTPIPRSFGHF